MIRKWCGGFLILILRNLLHLLPLPPDDNGCQPPAAVPRRRGATKAQTPEDKLAALKEMWVILPKHKASEKVQADLKTKISELTDQIEHAKAAPKKAAPGTFKFQRQGAGQVVFLGPPNTGKSLLLSKLTKAAPAIAPYPFTTREPVPGMMDFEDARVQLIDLPPVTADHYDSFITDVTRGADGPCCSSTC